MQTDLIGKRVHVHRSFFDPKDALRICAVFYNSVSNSVGLVVETTVGGLATVDLGFCILAKTRRQRLTRTI